MGRIHILGDESLKTFSDSLNGKLIGFPYVRPTSHKEIHDFMASNLSGEDIDVLILDLEKDVYFCLDLAMHLRLSLDNLHLNSLCPLVFISDLEIDSLLKVSNSAQIFLTEGVYVMPASEVRQGLRNVHPLKAEDYYSGFLSKVTIAPPSYSENDPHGLANQWGACVMLRAILGDDTPNDIPEKLAASKKELYFKYILACTVDDVQALLFPSKVVNAQPPLTVDAKGKRILLVDDMATEGWLYSLNKFFVGADIDVIDEIVTRFDNLSQDSKRKLRDNDYDLYLLDLRLGGIQEERIYDTNAFSGKEVLDYIKTINRGRQVIMFTASNKAWNFKTLLDPSSGANGYYIKESPSYKFSESFSKKSIQALREEVYNCFERNYLKDIYSFKEDYFVGVEGSNSMFDECRFQLDMAFDLADKASSEGQYRYAFISVFQSFEIISKHLVDVQNSETRKIMLMRSPDEMSVFHVRAIHPDLFNWLLYVQDAAVEFERKPNQSFSQFDKLAAVYLQYLNKKDDGVLLLLNQLIQIRNRIMHPLSETEQLEEDGRCRPVNGVLYKAKYLNRVPLFQDEHVASLMTQIIEAGLLKERTRDKKKELVIDKAVANSKTGIQLVFVCLKRFISSFE